MRHKTVERELGVFEVSDGAVGGSLAVRITTGGKKPRVHNLAVTDDVRFSFVPGANPDDDVSAEVRVLKLAIDALVVQLNELADNAIAAFETVKVA